MIRRFYLQRNIDESGVSGTGRVCEGAELSDGRCVVRWLTPTASTEMWDSLAEMIKVHGHGGKTVVEFIDEKPIEKSLAVSLALAAFLEKSAGEGSRGGHVVGHTPTGKPVYEGQATKKRQGGALPTAADWHMISHHHVDDHVIGRGQRENCAHCGKTIANVVHIGHPEHGDHCVGEDCADALLSGESKNKLHDAMSHEKSKQRHVNKLTNEVWKTHESGHAAMMAHAKREQAAKRRAQNTPEQHASAAQDEMSAKYHEGVHAMGEKITQHFGEGPDAQKKGKEALKHAIRAKYNQGATEDDDASLRDFDKRVKHGALHQHLDAAIEHVKSKQKGTSPKAGESDSSVAKSLIEELEKASVGEGSKGGKVIGHTKSGKPIYEKEGVTFQHHYLGETSSGLQMHKITAHDRSGRMIGHMAATQNWSSPKASKPGKTMTANMVHVDPEHRRKGIASAMYVHAEKHSGLKMHPDEGAQSQAGNALWSQKNRLFGKASTVIEDLTKALLGSQPACYVSWDGDGIGNKVALAEARDDEKTLQDISNKINAGQWAAQNWVTTHGGEMIESGGDEGLAKVPWGAVTEPELSNFRTTYKKAVGATVTIGIGEKISEATRARMLGKLSGKDRVQFWSPESAKMLAEKLSEKGEQDEAQKLREGGFGEIAKSLIEELEKASVGEGSRGGKIIGHTRSGRPIYEDAFHSSHNNLTALDHYRAASLHNQAKKKYPEGSPEHAHHQKQEVRHIHMMSHLDGSDPDFYLKPLSADGHRAAKSLIAALESSTLLWKSTGEGSKGGKIIGHTKTGKPIYASGQDAFGHPTYKKFPIPKHFSLISGQHGKDWSKEKHEALKQDLHNAGFKHTHVHGASGKWGYDEPNYIVRHNGTAEEHRKLNEIGKKHGQEAVFHRSGNHNRIDFMNGSPSHHGQGFHVSDHKDAYTNWPDKRKIRFHVEAPKA